MGDDFLDGDGTDLLNEEAPEEVDVPIKGGLMPTVVIQILKWIAIIVGTIIFIVTVVVITINIMGAGQRSQNRIPRSESYEGPPPVYSWYEEIPELRGVTNDQVSRTFVIEVRLGYEKDNTGTSVKIGDQTIPVTDMLNVWFASRSAEYLQNITNREEIRRRLLADLKKIVPEIETVAFTQYQILDF